MTDRHSCLLGIDLGTSGVKAGLYSLEGHNLANAHEEYPTICPRPNWCEQDPNVWWERTTMTIKKVISQANVDSADIECVGICGQGSGICLLDERGRTIERCIIWMDQRHTGCEARGTAGKKVYYEASRLSSFAKKLLWVNDNTKILRRAAKLVLPKDFIRFRLTGGIATDFSDAWNTGMFDCNDNSWSFPLIEKMGIPSQIFPELRSPAEISGEVVGSVARELGLRKGTPVVIGAMDRFCTVYGAGLVKSGRTVDNTGTCDVLVISSKPEDGTKLQNKYASSPNYIVPDLWSVRVAEIESAGSMLGWLRDQFGHLEIESGHQPYEIMDAEAELARLGSGGLLFFPKTSKFPSSNMRDKGSCQPLTGCSFLGLNETITRNDVIRAMLEGVSFELKSKLDQFVRSFPIEVDEIRAIGGAAKSVLWNQIKADVLGVPYCKLNIDEGGTFGAAILAGVGLGTYKDAVTPIEEIVRVKRKYEPNTEARKEYRNAFDLYVHWRGKMMGRC